MAPRLEGVPHVPACHSFRQESHAKLCLWEDQEAVEVLGPQHEVFIARSSFQFLETLSHGALSEPPPHGAVGAGRLDVELLDQPKRLRHEQRHPKGQQGGHEGIQGRLLCLEGDLELGRSGTLAEAGSECILAEETWVTL